MGCLRPLDPILLDATGDVHNFGRATSTKWHIKGVQFKMLELAQEINSKGLKFAQNLGGEWRSTGLTELCDLWILEILRDPDQIDAWFKEFRADCEALTHEFIKISYFGTVGTQVTFKKSDYTNKGIATMTAVPKTYNDHLTMEFVAHPFLERGMTVRVKSRVPDLRILSEIDSKLAEAATTLGIQLAQPVPGMWLCQL